MAQVDVVPGVSIVGLGNWGSSLAHACTAAGVPVREMIVRKRPSRRRSGWPIVAFDEASFDARLIWLCVQDDQISETTRQIIAIRPNLRGQIVLHSSGALSVNVVEAAKKAGAEVASAAPVMSFPTHQAVPLKNVLFAVEATGAAQRELYRILKKLGGKPFAIESNKKPLYHAAATLTSPLLVSHLSAAMETAQLAGLPQKQAQQWVEALATATMRNVFALRPERRPKSGLKKSFSGPFARGDVQTIMLHLGALAQHPILAEVYRSLARQAVERLPVKNVEAFKSILEGAVEKKRSRVRH